MGFAACKRQILRKIRRRNGPRWALMARDVRWATDFNSLLYAVRSSAHLVRYVERCRVNTYYIQLRSGRGWN